MIKSRMFTHDNPLLLQKIAEYMSSVDFYYTSVHQKSRQLMRDLIKIQLKNENFETIFNIVQKLISECSCSSKSVDAVVYFFRILPKIATQLQLLQIQDIFDTFMKYFSQSRYGKSVVIDFSKFLLNLNLSDGNITFVVILDHVYEYLLKFNYKLAYKLKRKKMQSICTILDNALDAGQIFYTLKQYRNIMSNPNELKEIVQYSEKQVKKIYEKIKCYEAIEEM